MKINIGCSDNIMPGYLNVDAYPPYIDPGKVEKVNLLNRWPWPDNSIDEIYAADIIEHIADKIWTMNEIHRVLKKEGIAIIIVPTTDGRGAFQDPTHVSFWNENSFWYYEKGNPYRERFAKGYNITAEFIIMNRSYYQTQDGPKLRIELMKP